MSETIQLQLVTPEQEVATADAAMVVVPGVEGDFGVMPQHAAVVSTLRPGVLAVHAGSDNVQEYVLTGGFAEVTSERVLVLANEAIPQEEFNEALHAERLAAAEAAGDHSQASIWRELARNVR